MSKDSDNRTRRRVLRTMGAATAGIAGVAGVASACSCYNQKTCEDGKEYTRECCECDNGTVCDDWYYSGDCPIQPR